MKISDLGMSLKEQTFFTLINEITDTGSAKDKDSRVTLVKPNGDVYDTCQMCNGTGINQFKRGGIYRSKGSVSPNKSDTMGGACGTCHGKGEVFLWNKPELDAITQANSVEELKQNSPDFYNTIINLNSQKYNSMLNDLDSGKNIPQSVVNAYMNKKTKEAEPKSEVISSPFKDDKRFRPSTHNRTINRR